MPITGQEQLQVLNAPATSRNRNKYWNGNRDRRRRKVRRRCDRDKR